MPLIKSISGIRGTIGGKPGESLSPQDIVKFTYAYCATLPSRKPTPNNGSKYKVVVGKDARLSGTMLENLVIGTLMACGVDIVKIGFASTPTTEMAVTFAKADGGIILTASHNPREWNALKLLNERGEFLTFAEGQAVLDFAETGQFDFAQVDELGKVTEHDYTDRHLDTILHLQAVDEKAIEDAHFRVVLDATNSVGGIIMPELLDRLGVQCICLNCEPTGDFVHNPEPLPKNLQELRDAVVREHADLGIAVDPDVDRLAFICEDGQPFGEEYTLVSIASYLFERQAAVSKAMSSSLEDVTAPFKPVAVSNLSSTQALKDVATKFGGRYETSAVGEVNVTTKMHEEKAIIGGEGNGGVIYPMCHYGRDAMVGVALFLTYLAHKKVKASELKKTFPSYQIAKNKIEVTDRAMIDTIMDEMKKVYAAEEICEIDGVKVTFPEKHTWVLLRRSNTEPVIRIFSEGPTMEEAEALAQEVIGIAESIIKG